MGKILKIKSEVYCLVKFVYCNNIWDNSPKYSPQSNVSMSPTEGEGQVATHVLLRYQLQHWSGPGPTHLICPSLHAASHSL